MLSGLFTRSRIDRWLLPHSKSLTGSVEVIVFSNLYEKNRELIIEDQPIIIREERILKMIMIRKEVNDHRSEEVAPPAVKSKQLFIKVDVPEEEYTKLIELRKLLFNKNGDIPVYLNFQAPSIN